MTHNHLSLRQRLLCGFVAIVTGAVYLGFCLYAIGAAWQRKEGDMPPVADWVQDTSLLVAVFPFGLLPGLDSILVAPLLNALFWSIVAGIVCAWLLRRQHPVHAGVRS